MDEAVNDNQFPELWNLYPDIWNTKSAFFTWLRGSLRQAVWNKYPPKLKFKNDNCFPPPEGLKTKAKSGNYCALSGEWTGKSKLEVDHIKGNASLTDWEDFTPFVLHLLATNDNMQLVDKEAHKIKSYAERQGISYEEAVVEKKIISMLKKENIPSTVDFLSEHGYNNIKSKDRRDVLRKILKGE